VAQPPNALSNARCGASVRLATSTRTEIVRDCEFTSFPIRATLLAKRPKACTVNQSLERSPIRHRGCTGSASWPVTAIRSRIEPFTESAEHTANCRSFLYRLQLPESEGQRAACASASPEDTFASAS